MTTWKISWTSAIAAELGGPKQVVSRACVEVVHPIGENAGSCGVTERDVASSGEERVVETRGKVRVTSCLSERA